MKTKPKVKIHRIKAGAELNGANLQKLELKNINARFISLAGANLRGIDFENINLGSCNLEGADLSGARLVCCDLSWARLRGARMVETRFICCNLEFADLRNSDLQGGRLVRTSLWCANMSNMNLQEAELFNAFLMNACLTNANIEGAGLPDFWICPQEGNFEGWIKLDKDTVAKVFIPAEAKRTACLTSRQCRADFVLLLDNIDRRYKQGKVIRAADYNPDIRVSDTGGVPFFMTKQEAVYSERFIQRCKNCPEQEKN